MTKNKLSIIIPFANEYPQIEFTINNLWCELRDKIDFEIMAVDNFCKQAADQIIVVDNVRKNRVADKGYENLLGLSKRHKWLKVLHYEDKLSHWQAKNLGVQNSSGEFLLFIDGHCINSCGSIISMYNYYREHHEELHGTLHLPLAYMLERRGGELIYKLVSNIEVGEVHYSFTRYRQSEAPYEVPCMSTCGMMMSRFLYDELGGWPKELGIYGGGENFINFTLAILGYTKNIYPTEPLYHYAEKRGYNFTYDDYSRNRIIATYMFGGEKLATVWTRNRKGNPAVLQGMLSDIMIKCKAQRDVLKSKQIIDIEDWLRKWVNHGE